MKEPIVIHIEVNGKTGMGKSMAIKTMVEALVKDDRFTWIDSRFEEGMDSEYQKVELVLK